ncbi:hypothetical protein E2C01_091668 [Portunus trituberculatus]|uniref:Uncharacterized protein n=1 Tax=Portunus trituberculatus TaxID=210409 RepID=A0A5B7JI47_PORTR|nr:hypothetical protein [Portunus trituberculatus]
MPCCRLLYSFSSLASSSSSSSRHTKQRYLGQEPKQHPGSYQSYLSLPQHNNGSAISASAIKSTGAEIMCYPGQSPAAAATPSLRHMRIHQVKFLVLFGLQPER